MKVVTFRISVKEPWRWWHVFWVKTKWIDCEFDVEYTDSKGWGITNFKHGIRQNNKKE